MSETIIEKPVFTQNNKKHYDFVAEEIGYKKDTKNNSEKILTDPTVGVHKAEHYNNGNYECRKVMEEIFTEPLSVEEGFYLGNAFKYLWRCQQKGSYLKDIAKVKEYCQFILDMHNV